MPTYPSRFKLLIPYAARWLRADILYLSVGGFWLTFGQISSTVLSTLFAIVAANYLTKTTYGDYRYINSLLSLFPILSLSGLGIALTQAVAKNYLATLKLAFVKQLKWSLLTTIASLAIAIYFALQTNLAFSLIFIIFAITAPLSNAASLYDSFLLGLGRFDLSTRYYLTTSVVLTLSTILIILFFSNQFLLFYPLSFFLQVAFQLFFYKHVQQSIPKKAALSVTSLGYGKHLSIINIIGILSDQLDSLLLFHLLGPIQLANYTLATAAPEIIKNGFKSLLPLSTTRLAKYSLATIKETLPRQLAILLVSSAILALAYIYASPFIFDYLFPKYREVVNYSQLLSLSFIAFPIYLIMGLFQSHKMQSQLYKINIFSPLVLIGLLVPFTVVWGIAGAIAARVISRYLSFAYSCYLTMRSKD